MPFVLTVDQIDSRTSPDLVDRTLARLSSIAVQRRFARTVGDEFQGLLEEPLSVVDAILLLMREDTWHIGLGIGPIELPLPRQGLRAARGAALLAAREAVEQAKSEPSHLVVASSRAVEPEAADVQAVFRVTGAVRRRRTAAGWEVTDLLDQGLTQQEVAQRLGVSRQAVGQRAQAAQWALDGEVIPTLTRLLGHAECASMGLGAERASMGGPR